MLPDSVILPVPFWVMLPPTPPLRMFATVNAAVRLNKRGLLMVTAPVPSVPVAPALPTWTDVLAITMAPLKPGLSTASVTLPFPPTAVLANVSV